LILSGSAGRRPTRTRAEPLHPWQEVASQRNEGRSHQCRSSSASRSGRRGSFAVSQRTERRQRRVRPARRDLGRVKSGAASAAEPASRSARSSAAGGEQRLEELPHYPVRERAFELGPARTEHLQPGLLSQPPHPRKQRGLANTGRALDREQPTTVGDRVDQATHRRKLGITLQQVELD
jgi:hypothetical protein